MLFLFIQETMAAVTDAVISWFCGGENSSTVDNVSIILHPPGNWASNTCTIDLVLLILHLVFCMMASLVLILIPACSISRATDHAYIIRYPGHVVRWLTYILYTLLCIGMIVESILTSSDHHFDSPPRLYIVPLAGFLAAIFVMVYYHYMEYWELTGMWPVQFLYWVCLLVAECFRASAFHHDNITSRHMIWTFNKSMVAVDAAMCVVEIYFLMKKVMARAQLDMQDLIYYDAYTIIRISVLKIVHIPPLSLTLSFLSCMIIVPIDLLK